MSDDLEKLRAYFKGDAPLHEQVADELNRLQAVAHDLTQQLETARAYARHERDLGAEPLAIDNAALQQQLDALKAELADYESTFELQARAADRAVAIWRDMNPGNDLVRPDRARLLVWLMGRLDDALEALRLDALLFDALAAEAKGRNDERFIGYVLRGDSIRHFINTVSGPPSQPNTSETEGA